MEDEMESMNSLNQALLRIRDNFNKRTYSQNDCLELKESLRALKQGCEQIDQLLDEEMKNG